MAGLPDVVVLAAGTDGSDGPTTAAGALADGESAARARALGLDLAARLADNDANPALAALGDLIVTGPSNTNLLDLYLVLVG
jgi:hydroxypyruvate reductase